MKGSFETSVKARKKDFSVTVVGAGVSGKSLAILARDLGYRVFVTEAKNIDEETVGSFRNYGIFYEEGEHSPKMLECDLVVLSSGVSPKSEPVIMAKSRGIQIMGEADFVSPYLKGKIIGITGSNGKTTTTMLTGYLLEKAGFRTGVAGNVGSPLAEHVGIDYDVVVAELSSFQLYWTSELRTDVSVVTNVDPDHIDWHGSLEEYHRCKRKILAMLRNDGKVICRGKDLEALYPKGFGKEGLYPLFWEEDGSLYDRDHILMLSDEAELASGEGRSVLFRYKDLPLLGSHNHENAAMAVTAFSMFANDLSTVSASLKNFKAPPHRCELVAVIKGVSYIDDSKGTNVAATVTALKSLKGRKTVILGGKGKGEDYAPLASAVASEAAFAILMGDEKENIRAALDEVGYKFYQEAEDMNDAVEKASLSTREEGGMVLLSPACTSWDRYPNYKERGMDFRRNVAKLVERNIDAG